MKTFSGCRKPKGGYFSPLSGVTSAIHFMGVKKKYTAAKLCQKFFRTSCGMIQLCERC